MTMRDRRAVTRRLGRSGVVRATLWEVVGPPCAEGCLLWASAERP